MNPSEFDTLRASEQRLWWFRGMKEILFAFLDPLLAGRAVVRAMEAGSGTGYMSAVLRKRYGWRLFPVELAWEGVRETAVEEGVAPVQADIARCPYEEASFDAVLSLDVLVHFPRGEEGRALAEFRRVLKPGGLLVLRVSALDVLRSRHSEFTHERQRFTRGRMAAALEAQGFTVLRSTYANSLLMPVALARFRIWEPLLRLPPASGTGPVAGWLDSLLYLPLAVERWWIARGGGFAAGQSLLVAAVRREG